MGCSLSEDACVATCSDHSDNKGECTALGCIYDDSKAVKCVKVIILVIVKIVQFMLLHNMI